MVEIAIFREFAHAASFAAARRCLRFLVEIVLET